MTHVEYDRARHLLGQMKRRARESHQARDYAKRDAYCQRHDQIALELVRAGTHLAKR